MKNKKPSQENPEPAVSTENMELLKKRIAALMELAQITLEKRIAAIEQQVQDDRDRLVAAAKDLEDVKEKAAVADAAMDVIIEKFGSGQRW